MGGQQKKKQTKSKNNRRKSNATKPSKPIELPANKIVTELPCESEVINPILESPKTEVVTLDDSGIESVKDESSTTSSANSVINEENPKISHEKSEPLPIKTPEPEKEEEPTEDLSKTLVPNIEQETEEGEIVEDTFTALDEPWKFCMNHRPSANIKKDSSISGNIRRMSLSPEMDEKIYDICDFASVEGFWQAFGHLQLPANLNHKTRPNVYLFKKRSHPIWEHHTNIGGCQWVLVIPRDKREYLNVLWAELCLAVVGNTFPEECADLINGIAAQKRQKEDRLVLWAKNFSKKELQMKIGKHLKEKVWNLNKNTHLCCNKFDDKPKQVLKNSSFQYRSSNADTYVV